MERKHDSRMTMELSTIIPTPKTMDPSVITFREYPLAHIMTNAVRIEIGMEVATIREALTSP